MRRGEWHERARQLRAEHPDWTNGDIAREIGVTDSAVWKVLNPERAREMARRSEANPARKQYKRRWENANDRQPCPQCGELMGIGTHRLGARCCWSCEIAERNTRRTIRRGLIAGMWADGWTLREIANALGTSSNSIGFEVNAMRADGWDVPHRYRMVNGRRLPNAA